MYDTGYLVIDRLLWIIDMVIDISIEAMLATWEGRGDARIAVDLRRADRGMPMRELRLGHGLGGGRSLAGAWSTGFVGCHRRLNGRRRACRYTGRIAAHRRSADAARATVGSRRIVGRFIITVVTRYHSRYDQHDHSCTSQLEDCA